MAAIEQHWRSTIRRGKLEASRRGLISGLHLGDDARERPVTQGVLGHRQDFSILASLRKKQRVRTKPDLLEAGRVEIEAGQCPERMHAGLRSEPRGNPGYEQGRGGVVAEPGGGGRDLVQAGTVEAAVSEPVVERGDAESERRTAPFPRARELGTKRG